MGYINMLSVDECRKLIDNDEKYTDKEIEEIRATLYGLARLAFDVWEKERKGNKETGHSHSAGT